MKKTRRHLFPLCVLLAASPAFAGKIGFVGTANQTIKRTNAPAPQAPTTETLSGNIGFGGGLLLGFSLSPQIDFETGGLYYQRRPKTTTETTLLTTTTVDKLKTVEVPLLFRFWMGHVVSLGLGGYFIHYMGTLDSTTEVKSKSSGLVTSTTTTALANRKKYDAGAMASLALDLPLGARSSFLIDGRYQYGLVDQVKNRTQAYAEKYDAFQALVGLRFRLN